MALNEPKSINTNQRKEARKEALSWCRENQIPLMKMHQDVYEVPSQRTKTAYYNAICKQIAGEAKISVELLLDNQDFHNNLRTMLYSESIPDGEKRPQGLIPLAADYQMPRHEDEEGNKTRSDLELIDEKLDILKREVAVLRNPEGVARLHAIDVAEKAGEGDAIKKAAWQYSARKQLLNNRLKVREYIQDIVNYAGITPTGAWWSPDNNPKEGSSASVSKVLDNDLGMGDLDLGNLLDFE